MKTRAERLAEMIEEAKADAVKMPGHVLYSVTVHGFGNGTERDEVHYTRGDIDSSGALQQVTIAGDLYPGDDNWSSEPT